MPTGNTQQQINYGAQANDGQGDPLRTAFIKTDENFDNIWLAGPVGSNVRITNNTIGVIDINGNLILSPNGIGVIQTNNHVIPRATRTYDLGAANLQYRAVYANTATFQTLNAAGDLSVSGNLTVQGNIIQVGNIVTETLTIQLANAATTANAANGAGITVGANDNVATLLYNASSNVWTTNIGVSAVGNITAPYFIGNGSQLTGITSYSNANATSLLASFGSNTISTTGNITAGYFIGNGSQLTGITSYANANVVAYGQAGWAGNIIPATSNVYSLGNSTNQWSDLYVSNATIYMNNVPVSLTAGNVLTVNGEDVVTTNANGTVDLANLAIDNNNIYNTQGQGVIISNFNYVTAEAETAYVQIPAGNSSSDLNVVQEQGNVRLVANAAVWNLDTTGNLTIPNGGYINFVNTGGITQTLNEDLKFTVSDDEEDGWAVQSTVNDGAGNDLTRMQVRYDGVRINTDIPTNSYYWNFRDTGEFEVPGPIRGPVGGNLVIDCGDASGSDTFIDIQTRSHVGDALISNIRIANPNVTVSTSSGAYNWTFGGSGNLTLPLSGNLVGSTANNNGYLSWFGNSSGDGNGYTTMRLVPDDTLEGNDQYLIIDPTAPGHIHIRAGGTQDNSSADLFLGGENSYFKVNAGANNEVRISANSYPWTFGTDSVLTLPGEGILRSIGDVVTLQSYNVGTGNVNSVYLGSGGGLGFFDQDIGGNWLEIFRSGAEPQIRVPVGLGNLNIQTAQGNTAYDWIFDNTGNLTTPGNITVANVVTANTFVSNAFNVVTAGNLSITSQYGLGFTGTILEDNGTLELIANGGGAVVVGWDSTYGNGLGNIATVNFNEVGGEGILLRTGNRAATEYNWNFDNTGNLTLPGNTFTVNYANGTPVSLGGGGYGNADVSNFLANYGSNTISTTGNITAGNLIGNISITGNVQGTSSNVSLVAGSYTWTFDNTGNLQGNLSLTGGNITINNAPGGNEGAEVNWALPAAANTSLNGTVVQDVFQNGMRFFESSGNNRGLTMDLGNVPNGTATAVGYRDIPQISLSGNVTANATNAGQHFYSTTAGNLQITLPDNANVAYPTGATLTVVVNAAGNVVVAQGTGVSLYMAGSSTTGNRTVGAYGLASVMKVATNTWVISGTGVY